MILIAFVAACAGPQENPKIEEGGAVTKTDDTKAGEQEERWSGNDAPNGFAGDLDYTFASLPLNGAAERTPWASSYWPVYEDSINHKWDGSNPSSAAKYGQAFSVTGVEDAVSQYHGIDNNKSRKACSNTSECDSKLSESCGKRAGQEKGYCIPTWWGICHAWAPAAIMLPEAKYPVTVNGVTFKVNDIKALVTLAHNSTTSKFVSLRCEESDDKPTLDTNGRASSACRDTNPGTFHVILANYLGKKKESFVYDRTWDDEVWNQPLRAFRVTEKKEVTATEANKLLGVTAVGGTTTKKSVTATAGQWVVAQELAVTAGQNLKVTTTGTGDGDLFIQFGSAPTASSKACSSEGSSSTESCEVTVPAGATKAFVSILGYSAATVEVTIVSGGAAPTGYVFNADAKKLIFIKSEVDYIGEASSSTDGNLGSTIDSYTNTDYYEYVLELDAAGKVIGGEWSGSSKLAHPDFLWLPTGLARTSVAGGKITWANVKSLLDQSQVAPGTPPSTGVKTVKEHFSLAQGAWKHYGPYAVAAGKNLTAKITGTGDADLYVRKGATPTSSAYDCRPYKDGSVEECQAAGGGAVYVSVNGYTASTVDLEITYEEGAGGPVTPPPASAHLNESGSVTQNEMKVFQVAVQAGKKIVIKTTAPRDVDLYTRMDAAPTTSNFLTRQWTESGNETITFTPTSSGALFIGVHGYEASSFTLVTSDN
ncbi:MAG: pre-peptidase C-terminal domain-containing protein [Deltaproteobacteria bacterium]|nr:pre-peptidase C-terminal domain-containing protein [Deltaproteobacteria bacterium]